MGRRLLVAAIAAAVLTPAAADAQVWRPKKPKKATPAATDKKKPGKKKKRGKKKKPAPAKDPDVFVETHPETEVLPGEGADDGADDGAEPDTGAETDPGTETGADEDGGDDGDTVRIDDDLEDVGADVHFSEDDLATDAADGGGGTRLETRALAYGRLAVDTIHDPPPAVTAQLHGKGEDVIAFRAHARAEGTSRFRDRVKVKVAGRADAELGLDSNTEIGVERYEAQIWDTYADAYLPSLDVRFGKQLITWGTADLLSPNDVVNPRDLRRGIAIEPDEMRLPVLAASARAFTGPLSLQGLWIPVAPTNRFDLLEGDYAILGPHAATDVERHIGALVSALADDPTLGPAVSPILAIGGATDAGIESGELGASASIETRPFDLHAYFLWGHERNPRIRIADDLRDFLINTPPDMLTPQVLAERLAQLAQQGIPAVQVDYPRRLHTGVAMATRLEPVGIKLDAAYSPKTSTILLTDPGEGPVLGQVEALPQITATLSLDYDRGTELSAVIEASHVRVLDVPAGEQVFQMHARDHMTVIGARVSWNPRSGPVTVSGLGFVDVDSPSYAVRPALDLSGNDHWSLEIAATLYGGPAGSFGGIYDAADEVSLTVQYGL